MRLYLPLASLVLSVWAQKSVSEIAHQKYGLQGVSSLVGQNATSCTQVRDSMLQGCALDEWNHMATSIGGCKDGSDYSCICKLNGPTIMDKRQLNGRAARCDQFKDAEQWYKKLNEAAQAVCDCVRKLPAPTTTSVVESTSFVASVTLTSKASLTTSMSATTNETATATRSTARETTTCCDPDKRRSQLLDTKGLQSIWTSIAEEAGCSSDSDYGCICPQAYMAMFGEGILKRNAFDVLEKLKKAVTGICECATGADSCANHRTSSSIASKTTTLITVTSAASVTATTGSAMSSSVAPEPTGSLKLDLTKAPDLVFKYETSAQDEMNWIALYAKGKGPLDQKYPGYTPVTYARATLLNGTATISDTALSNGDYTAFFLYKDGYKWLSDPVDFTWPLPAADVVIITRDSDKQITPGGSAELYIWTENGGPSSATVDINLSTGLQGVTIEPNNLRWFRPAGQGGAWRPMVTLDTNLTSSAVDVVNVGLTATWTVDGVKDGEYETTIRLDVLDSQGSLTRSSIASKTSTLITATSGASASTSRTASAKVSTSKTRTPATLTTTSQVSASATNSCVPDKKECHGHCVPNSNTCYDLGSLSWTGSGFNYSTKYPDDENWVAAYRDKYSFQCPWEESYVNGYTSAYARAKLSAGYVELDLRKDEDYHIFFLAKDRYEWLAQPLRITTKD